MRFALLVLFGLAAAALSACHTSPPAAPSAGPAPRPAPATAPSPAKPTPPAPAAMEAAKPVTRDTARNIAQNCFTCHGPEGRSPGAIPSISRLSAANLAARLKNFQTGAEPATVMTRHAKAYTDAEIQAVANYIAALNK